MLCEQMTEICRWHWWYITRLSTWSDEVIQAKIQVMTKHCWGMLMDVGKNTLTTNDSKTEWIFFFLGTKHRLQSANTLHNNQFVTFCIDCHDDKCTYDFHPPKLQGVHNNVSRRLTGSCPTKVNVSIWWGLLWLIITYWI